MWAIFLKVNTIDVNGLVFHFCTVKNTQLSCCSDQLTGNHVTRKCLQ